jgi:hypothetical protein
MIAQLILSALLSGILVYAWVQYRRVPAVAFLAVFATISGLYFVWVPSHATLLAELAGIGRGVDLFIYIWVVMSLLALLNVHLKIRAQTEVITALVRQLALANTRSRESAP